MPDVGTYNLVSPSSFAWWVVWPLGFIWKNGLWWKRGTRGFDWWFLRHRSLPGLETSTKWLVSSTSSFWYVICMSLKSFEKNHIFFKDNLWKIAVKIHLILCARSNGTRNQKLKSLSNLFWRHESNDGCNLPNELWLKIAFFEVTSIIPFCGAISIFMLSRLNFEIWTYPETRFDEYNSILTSNSFFHYWLKMKNLKSLAPRTRESNLEFGGSCGDTKSIVRIRWEVDTQSPF